MSNGARPNEYVCRKKLMLILYIIACKKQLYGDDHGMTISSVSENMKQLELPYVACGSVKIPRLWRTVWQVFI